VKKGDLNVAVLGVGMMGSLHAGLLSNRIKGARLRVVSDPRSERALTVATELGARVEEDPLAAIEARDVDAVVIASPGPVHEQQVMKCVESTKPVLCEKPLTTHAEGSYRIVKCEQSLGLRLVQVGFMRRFDADFQRLRQMIVSKELGLPLMLHLVHRNVDAPEGFTSPMAITESVVHEVDTIRFLLNEEISSVMVYRGYPSSRAPSGVADPMLILFETESGRLADVEIFVRSAVAYEVRAELVAENGTARTGLETNSARSGPGNRWGGALPQSFVERFGPAYQQELQTWVDSARTGTIRGASAWDGYAAQAVCEAGVEALRSGTRQKVGLLACPVGAEYSNSGAPGRSGKTGR
jgi:myo-inositol 2-dehydrogenase / D-chiro-inositol 1-dehydrogenase